MSNSSLVIHNGRIAPNRHRKLKLQQLSERVLLAVEVLPKTSFANSPLIDLGSSVPTSSVTGKSFSAKLQGKPFDISAAFTADSVDSYFANYNNEGIPGFSGNAIVATVSAKPRPLTATIDIVFSREVTQFGFDFARYRPESLGDRVTVTVYDKSQVSQGSAEFATNLISSDNSYGFAGLRSDVPIIRARLLVAIPLAPDELRETGELFILDNVRVQALPRITKVVASGVPERAAGRLGTFLSGVQLDQNFDVSIAPPNPDLLLTMRYSLNGGNYQTVAFNSGWNFSFDTGNLAAGEHSLSIDLILNGAVIDSATRTLIVSNVIPIQMKVDDRLAASTNYVSISKVRLLEGVPLSLDPQVEIGESFNLLPAYNSRLAIQPVNRATNVPLSDINLQFVGGKVFRGAMNAADYADTIKVPTASDYDLFLVPRVAYRTNLVKFNGSTPQNLVVASLPSWMSQTTEKTFRGLSTTDPAFDGSGSAYAISFDLNAIDKDFGVTSETPFGIFDGLASKLGIGAKLVAYARLTSSQPAELQAQSLYATAILMGKQLLSSTTNLQNGSIRASGTLNGLTLEGTTVTIASPVIDLTDVSGVPKVLLDKSIALMNVPTPIPGVRAGLKGALKIELTKLATQLSLKIDISGAMPKLVESETFIDLIADANLDASLVLDASLNFAGINLVSFIVGASVNVLFSADLRLNFSGSLTSPAVTFNKGESKAYLAVAIKTAWDVAALNQNPSVQEKLKGEPITSANMGDFKTIGLFTLDVPSEFTRFAAGELSGAVTVKNDSAITGQIVLSNSAVQGVRTAVTLPDAVTATITLPGITNNSVQAFSYEANIYSLASDAISAGQHTLETILVNENTQSEQIVDTWDLGLLVPNVPDPLFGFSTGFLARNVFIPAAAVEFGRSYRVKVRFQSNRSGSGETIVAELRNGSVQLASPEISATSQFGSLLDEKLDFGADTNGSARGFVLLRNTGDVPLHVESISASPGFRVGYSLNLPTTLHAGGGVLAVPVDVVDPSAVASGSLAIVSDDPESPLSINLNSLGGLTPLPPVAKIGDELVVLGTSSIDIVSVSTDSLTGSVSVNLNGIAYGPYSSVQKIVARLGDGNDRFSSPVGVVIPMVVYGQGGNDFMQTGAGNDELYGGAGVDTLRGGGGSNLIVTDSNRPTISNIGGNLNFVENGGPLRLVAGTAVVVDSDSSSFSGGRLIAKFVAGGLAQDRLAILNSGLVSTTSDGRVLYNSVSIGSFSGGVGTAPLVVQLNSEATPQRVTALVKQLTYQNMLDNPSTAPRTILIQIDDGDGGVSVPGLSMKTLTVVAKNDAPRITGISGTTTYLNLNAPVNIATVDSATGSAAIASDIDSASFDGGVLSIRITSGAHASNRISLGGAEFTRDGEANIDGTFNVRRNGIIIGTTSASAGIGTNKFEIKLNANATSLIVQQLLRRLQFSTTSNTSTADRVVAISLSDGDGGASVVTKTIDVS